MKKILLVFGTRPEAIKMAPLFIELNKYPNEIIVKICVTAQHRQMLDQVLDFFKIKPEFDLDIMTKEQTLYGLTSNILNSTSEILKKELPDMVLVHGDTSTTFATSLASFYLGVPVGHVEAGLRSNDISAPFPEEFYRKSVGSIAKWHFCPTNASKNNLLIEKIDPNNIWVTGNTVIDTLNIILDRFKTDSKLNDKINTLIKSILKFDIINSKFILITAHRRENYGDGIQNICEAIAFLAKKYPFFNFVYIIHLNPIVSQPVLSILGNIKNVHILEPLNYEIFIYLLKYSYFVLTDSGGLQEEASSLGKPILVMRDITERPEAMDSGILRIVGVKMRSIIKEVSKIIDSDVYYKKIAVSNKEYGDGQASKKITEIIRLIHC